MFNEGIARVRIGLQILRKKREKKPACKPQSINELSISPLVGHNYRYLIPHTSKRPL